MKKAAVYSLRAEVLEALACQSSRLLTFRDEIAVGPKALMMMMTVVVVLGTP